VLPIPDSVFSSWKSSYMEYIIIQTRDLRKYSFLGSNFLTQYLMYIPVELKKYGLESKTFSLSSSQEKKTILKNPLAPISLRSIVPLHLQGALTHNFNVASKGHIPKICIFPLIFSEVIL
jgi:hypothetical protein